MKKVFKEFKEFITKGSVLDLALAVVIGAAFNKIVSSLVADIITPLLGLVIGNVSIKDLKWVIRPAEINGMGEIINAELALTYGVFIQAIFDFLTIAFFLFLAIKIIMASKKRFEKISMEAEKSFSNLSKKVKKKLKKQAKAENKTTEEILIEQNQKMLEEEKLINENQIAENTVISSDDTTENKEALSPEIALLTEIRDLLKK